MLLKKDIKYLVVHCSDTDNNKNLRASDIHKMHLGFGWDGIGYHKVICRNGDIESGRPEYWVGAHIYEKNIESLGVCLIGKNNFKPVQFESLFKILKKWKTDYEHAKILGHSEFTNTKKTCPNFDVQRWIHAVGLND